MFVRKRTRTTKGYGESKWRGGLMKSYFQLCESYRGEDGKPRHRVIVSWTDSPTIEQAIIDYEEHMKWAADRAESWRELIEKYGPRFRRRAECEAYRVQFERRAAAAAAKLAQLRLAAEALRGGTG